MSPHLIPTRPEHVAVELHAEAKSGRVASRQELLAWAYGRAQDYYSRKVPRERLLSARDAEDLAAAFCLEFDRAWPRMQSLVHYTRRMLKNNLQRFLSRKRRRGLRECMLPHDRLCEHQDRLDWIDIQSGVENLDDATWLKLHTVQEVLRASDPITRAVLERRTEDPPVSYRDIAEELGSTETALRMRAARFYQAVRRVHHRAMGSPDPHEATVAQHPLTPAQTSDPSARRYDVRHRTPYRIEQAITNGDLE